MATDGHIQVGGVALTIPPKCRDSVWVYPVDAGMRIWERGQDGNEIRAVAKNEPVCALIDPRLQSKGQLLVFLNSGQIGLCVPDGSKPKPKPAPRLSRAEERAERAKRDEPVVAPVVDPVVAPVVEPPAE